MASVWVGVLIGVVEELGSTDPARREVPLWV